MKLTFEEFNKKLDTKEIVLDVKDVCFFNSKRYSINAVKNENSLLLIEIPLKPKTLEIEE